MCTRLSLLVPLISIYSEYYITNYTKAYVQKTASKIHSPVENMYLPITKDYITPIIIKATKRINLLNITYIYLKKRLIKCKTSFNDRENKTDGLCNLNKRIFIGKKRKYQIISSEYVIVMEL